MRSRPEIEIELPPAVHPGERLRVQVTVRSGSQTPIDFIRLSLRCTVRLNTGEEGAFTSEHFARSKELAGPGQLGEGTHQYKASFVLPEDTPLTYVGNFVFCSTAVSVQVSIPWWLDALESQDVAVTQAPRARPADAPRTSSSLQRNEPFVEVSLPRTCFAPGETIEGAVAFGNLGGRRPDAVDLSLVGIERMIAPGRSTVSEAHRTTHFKEIQRAREGQEVLFRLRIPADTAPTFAAPAHSLEHVFEAKLTYDGASVGQSVPLVIGAYPTRTGGEAGGGERAPVGADRWRAAWAASGEAFGLSLARGGLQLGGRIAGCEATVCPREGRGGAPGVEAVLRFAAPWGLDLKLVRRRLLQRGIDTGDPAFDDRFVAVGRDEDQVRRALKRALRDALLGFEDASLDDEAARVWSATAASDADGVRELLGRVAALAAAAQAAGAAIPPPRAMAACLPDWERFAGSVGGQLVVGGMRLAGGRFDGAPIDIETRFSGAAPSGATIALGIEPPLARAPDLDGAGASAAAPAAARALREAIERQAAALAAAPPGAAGPELCVSTARMTLRLRGPLRDPGAARETLASMVALATALQGERRGGPYR